METIDIKFLEGKSLTIPNPWNKGVPYTVYASSGNINRISDSVFKFTEYNFLPADETDVLDGHYTFFVNYKTFEYLVYKSSDYGSFTYTIPCEFGAFLTKESLPEFSRKRVEATIASKLLGAYFHDSNAVNRRGKNLFSDGTEPEEAGTNIYNEKYYRYSDGRKYCLICDNRAYKWVDHIETYSNIELKALEVLCGYKQPNIQLDEVEIKSIVAKLRCKKGNNKSVKLDVVGAEFLIFHEMPQIGYGRIGVFSGETLISYDNFNKSLTEFVRQIPDILNNYATL